MDRAAYHRTVRKPYTYGDSLPVEIKIIKVKLSAKIAVHHLHGENHTTQNGQVTKTLHIQQQPIERDIQI
jgi:hypothetical protein